MRILVINPNTTSRMTDAVAACARGAAGPGTEIVPATPVMGPASIESHYDEALAVPGLLDVIARAEAAGPGQRPDGYVLACFGDPGLDAAREVATGPVVGIAEAAFRFATYLGRGFSVVTTLARTAGRARDLAVHYGVDRQCLRVRACEVAVLDLEDPASDARARITDEAHRAVAEDGADAIVLGCAGMADLAAAVAADVGVPVVDGVAAATRQVEALVALGLAPAARGELAAPPPKDYTGLLAGFTVASPEARA